MTLCLQGRYCLFHLPRDFAMKTGPFALRERRHECERRTGIAKVGPP